MAAHPELDKLAAVQQELAAVQDFLQWASDRGLALCRMEDLGERTGLRGDRVVQRWNPQDWRAVVSEHFGLDDVALERERRAILAALGVQGQADGR